MEQTLSEADIFSASQVIPRHLDCKDHYCVHILPLDHILSQ
jgi:hypothetical protein